MAKIIGGMFGFGGIPDQNISAPPFQESKAVYFTNARSGLAFLVERLSPAHVWLPSYLCETIVFAINGRKSKIKFYEVNSDLVSTSLEWLDNVHSGDLVILVDYFGFHHDLTCIKRIKERGAWILEDACQAFLTGDVGLHSDFVLYSPRKFLGVPDGGILIFNSELEPLTIKLKSPPTEWWLNAFYAGVLRREFDLHGGNRRWFELFQETEQNSPTGSYATVELSRLLLQNGFDYMMIIKKRIENYQLLLEELQNIALFPNLPPKIVPVGFPIRVQNRDRIRNVLFEHEIYPPIHWAIQGVVPDQFHDSHSLSHEIMTLPCDQRYGRDDMMRMTDVLLGVWNK